MTDQNTLPHEPVPLALRRAAALCEVLAVFVGSMLMQWLTLRMLGMEPWHEVEARMVEAGSADFLRLARLAAVDLLVRYTYLLGLAFLIGRWHRRRRWRTYGLHTGGRSRRRLVKLGLWIYAANIVPVLLIFIDRWIPLGSGPEHWSLFPDTYTWDFMLYMTVASFAVVPILEELAARGYMQTRLSEDFGPAGAILITAFFFAAAHSQYFRLEVMSIGMLSSIVISSVIIGYAFHRTGSLWPGIIAHALINLPVPDSVMAEAVQLSVMAGLLVWCHREAIAEWSRFRTTMTGVESRAALIAAMIGLVTLMAVLLLLQNLTVPLLTAMFLVAVITEIFDRRASIR
jgi:membrane protease YdiL (CAAX protease family)